MKDYTEEACRKPSGARVCRTETLDRVQFCLGRLFKSRTASFGDEVVLDLTFEELLGALLSAEHHLNEDAEDEDS